MFPSNGLVTPAAPFPPPGPSEWFPGLDGTMRRSDSRPSLSLRFVAFASRYHRRVHVCSLRPGRTIVGSGELVFRVPSRNVGGNDRGSQVPGDPRVPWPCSQTPAGPCTPGHTAHRAVPAADKRGSRKSDFSRLNRTASGLAVYASQGGSPLHHARLASGCWPALPAGIRSPAGCDERFPSSSLFPFPELLAQCQFYFPPSRCGVSSIFPSRCGVSSIFPQADAVSVLFSPRGTPASTADAVSVLFSPKQMRCPSRCGVKQMRCQFYFPGGHRHADRPSNRSRPGSERSGPGPAVAGPADRFPHRAHLRRPNAWPPS